MAIIKVIEKLGKFIVDTLRKGRANFLGILSPFLKSCLLGLGIKLYPNQH